MHSCRDVLNERIDYQESQNKNRQLNLQQVKSNWYLILCHNTKQRRYSRDRFYVRDKHFSEGESFFMTVFHAS